MKKIEIPIIEIPVKPNYTARRLAALALVVAALALGVEFVRVFIEWNSAPICDWGYIREIGSMGCKP
jgi:hypothetical protein